MKLTLLKNLMLPMVDSTDKHSLRQFAWQMSIAFPLFFSLLLPWIFAHEWPIWPFLISSLFLISAYFIPKALYPLYVVWMVIASLLGWANTQLILALAFFLLVLPLGLCLRVFNKLGYEHKLNRNGASYWQQRDISPARENLKEPF